MCVEMVIRFVVDQVGGLGTVARSCVLARAWLGTRGSVPRVTVSRGLKEVGRSGRIWGSGESEAFWLGSRNANSQGCLTSALVPLETLHFLCGRAPRGGFTSLLSPPIEVLPSRVLSRPMGSISALPTSQDAASRPLCTGPGVAGEGGARGRAGGLPGLLPPPG